MTPFTQYKPWMIKRYSEPLFRIPVEISSTCPHGRCAFCAENGSRAQQTQQQKNPIEQAKEAIRFAKRRYRAKKWMLYIQSFTADLTKPDQQKTILALLGRFDFTAISIGTRPDCLPESALHFLNSLKTSGSTPLEVWVELGIQTTNDNTLKKINRGHDWACGKQTLLHLADRGIHVAPHLILGLPGETEKDWNRTASELAALPVSGIKLHNMNILKGTELAEQYAQAPFPLLNHWEYAEGLIEFLRRIPAEIPVMRISTDTPKDQLIAPHWHLRKGQFLDYISQQRTFREINQGDQLKAKPRPNPSRDFTPVPTDDGSITFFSETWKEHYHTQAGARLEAEKKFVEPSGLKERLTEGPAHLLDVCFGLGNNSLAALCAAAKAPHPVEIPALEMDKLIVRAASECFRTRDDDPVNWQQVLQELLHHSTFHNPHSTISLHWGDARWLIQAIPDHSIDVVFHDPFSTQHCPELWTVEFFKQLHRVMKPPAVLLTYSSAMPVRGAMREAGFYIAETVPGHQMGNGTITSPTALAADFLTIEKLDARRAIPYRDPYLSATSKAILRQRQEAVEQITD